MGDVLPPHGKGTSGLFSLAGGLAEKVRGRRLVLKDESKSAGWPEQASRALSAEEEAGGGGCRGMGLSGHPKVGRPRPGVPAAPPGEAEFPALAGASSPPPLRLPRGFPTLTTWPEAAGARSRWGYKGGRLWRGAPARTGCFSGLATGSFEESTGRNAAFPECLAFNPEIRGRGSLQGRGNRLCVWSCPWSGFGLSTQGDGS